MKRALMIMMIRFSALVVVPAFLTLLRPVDATTAAVAAATTTSLSAPSLLNKQQSTLSAAVASTLAAESKERLLETETASGYVFYSMPPFALSFRSPAYLLSSQEQADDVLLASRLSATLIDIVSEFLLESFRQEIAGTSADDASIPEMVRQLVKMDFQQVKLEYRKTVVEGQEDAQRRRRRRLLQQQQQPEEQHKEWFTLYITFAGMSYFVAPVVRSESSYSNTAPSSSSSSSTVVASLPSQEYMSDLLGGWIETYMTNDYAILKQDLRASDEPLLQQLETLMIFTNVGPPGGSGNSFGASGNNARAPSQSYMTPMDTVLTVLVVIVSVATLGAAYFLVRPYWLSRRKEQFILQHQQQLGAFPATTVGATTSSSTLNTSRGGGLSSGHLGGDEPSLPGRGHEYDPELGPEDEHDGEEQVVVFDEKHSAVAESDRWLQQHRPDLLAVIQRTSQRNLTTGAEDPTSSSHEDDPDTIMRINSNRSRKRSNPLQYLYGGMFVKNQQPKRPPALNHQQSSNSLASQDGQVVVQGDDDDNNNNNASNEQDTAAGGPTWWGKLASSLQVVGGDGRHRGSLPCDEDPRRYSFPYQDFPRTDGTPCLIYEEGQEGSDGPVTLRRGSNNLSPEAAAAMDEGAENSKKSRLLSNDAFKRQLSMHSINSSLEDKDEQRQQGSNILDGMNGSGLEESIDVLGDYLNDDNGDEEEDDIDDNSSAGSNPKFTNKLERLVAMRHRHYEQETILQKARQKKQDRQKAEARERELKLRRHEMELDVEEIEASLTPRALQRKRSTGAQYGSSHNNDMSDNGDTSSPVVPGNSTPNSKASGYVRSASNMTPIASNTTNKKKPHDECGNGEQRKFHRSSHSNPDSMYDGPSSAATAISDLTSSTQGSWSGGCSADIAAAAGFASSLNGGDSSSNKSGGGASGSGASGSGSGGPSLRREEAQTTGSSKPPAPRQIPRSNSGAPPSPHPTHRRSQTAERSSSLSTLPASQQKPQLPQAPPSPSPSQKSKTNRRRSSHRRSYSHGTQQNPHLFPSMEEKKDNDSGTVSSDGKSHKRKGSNAEDVLAFGIAAYTDFV